MKIAFANRGAPMKDELILVMRMDQARQFVQEMANTINLVPFDQNRRVISVTLTGKFGPGDDPTFSDKRQSPG